MMDENGKDSIQQRNFESVPEFRVAIVGGGPGGLFAAWYLAAKAGTACNIRIFEASNRLGGKIVTGCFAGVGLYEAGVAEIYDYSAIGPDPLRDLIENDLGLEITHIKGGGCILDGHIIPETKALADHFGTAACEAAMAFRRHCARLLKPKEFYKSAREADNMHKWARISGEDILATEIDDDIARRYIRVMCHSDVAAPPHLTTGLNLLKNVLMDVDGYLDIYSVNGGNEQIVHRLADRLDAEVRLNAPVRSVQPMDDGTARLTMGAGGATEVFDADFVVFALPITALSIIDWRSAKLRRAVVDHIRYFDRPAHYLRASLLFERPFWREHLDGAWWMLDAFDGCCVYDEGARHDLGGAGALGFLIGGNSALELANLSDERIEEMCLDALPAQFSEARKLLVDRRIHRWMASVNAVPGGSPVRDRLVNHRPDETLPQVLLVGDYLFDSTLNGVLDSADSATDLILSDVLLRRRTARRKLEGTLGADVWYPGANEEVRDQFFNGPFVAELLKLVWDLEPGARVLNLGSASGMTVAALRELGFEAFGIESGRLAHARTAEECREFNLLGDPTDMPFPEAYFDVVIDTGLCYLPRPRIAEAVAELRRVARRGVMLGSVVTDLTIETIERYDLHANVKTLWSRWNWSEEFFAKGFDHALIDPDRLAKVWRWAQASGAGPGHWYEDPEAVLYCFYDVQSSAAQGQQAPQESEGALGRLPQSLELVEVGQEGIAASGGALP
jgi:monoamine oxidase/SAM-dependent methyltransferase